MVSRGDKHAYLALSTWMLKEMLEENDKNDERGYKIIYPCLHGGGRTGRDDRGGDGNGDGLDLGTLLLSDKSGSELFPQQGALDSNTTQHRGVLLCAAKIIVIEKKSDVVVRAGSIQKVPESTESIAKRKKERERERERERELTESSTG